MAPADSIASVNFSIFTTMLLEVFSTAVAMLLANSAPGIAGVFVVCDGGGLMFGSDVLCGS